MPYAGPSLGVKSCTFLVRERQEEAGCAHTSVLAGTSGGKKHIFFLTTHTSTCKVLELAVPTPRQLGGCSDWNRRVYEVASSPSLREFKGRLGGHLPGVVTGGSCI